MSKSIRKPIIVYSLIAVLALTALAFTNGSSAPIPKGVHTSTAAQAFSCPSTSSIGYSGQQVHQYDNDQTVRPTSTNPDKNIEARGYENHIGLTDFVTYGGTPDQNAPQLATLFVPERTPTFTTGKRVHTWVWGTSPDPGSPGPVYTPGPAYWDVTLLGLQTVTGEEIHSPEHGYNLGGSLGTGGAIVLYASNATRSITLAFHREDSAATGYIVHISNICVDVNLLALYEDLNSDNTNTPDTGPRYVWFNNAACCQYSLPGFAQGKVIGTADDSGEILVSIRDSGDFMDPRSETEWWINHPDPGPPAPTLIAPANSAVTGDSTPDLTWNAVGSGSTYHVQIDTVNTFVSPDQDFTTGADITLYTASPALTDGTYYWRVQATDAWAVTGPWSSTRSFTVDTTPPTVPNLLTPTDTSSTSDNTPTLDISDSTGSPTGYDFEIADDAGFSTNVTSGSSATSTFTTSALALGVHYWRARSFDAADNESSFSAPFSFTVTPPPPAAPALTAPANNLQTQDQSPDFSWGSVANAEVYQIQIDTDINFGSPDRDVTGGAGVTTYPASPDLPEGAYFWRVRGKNTTYSVDGTWSAVRSFTVDVTPPPAPDPVTPANGAFTTDTTPTLTVTAPSGAVQYDFELATDTGFSSIIRSGTVGTNSFTPTAVPTGVYYYHARARDAAGNQSAYGGYFAFTITPPPPVAPALTSPANNFATRDQTPDFVWGSVATGDTYRIQIASDSGFTAIVQDVTGGSGVLAYTASTLAEATYYWRVLANNSLGAPGAWSGSRTIIIDLTPPNPPALSSPADNFTTRATPTFQWAAPATANAYQFEYATDVGLSSVVYQSVLLTTLSHKPPNMAYGTYYWSVRARDAQNNWSAWTSPRLINILPPLPAAPALTAPANGLFTNDDTPFFTWNSVANGDTYHIQISASSTFASIAQEATGASGVLNYTATALSEGKFYWRVQALNLASEAGAWSSARSFTADITAPPPPALSAPGDGASPVGVPTYSWLASPGANAYQFQYATDTGFTTGVYTSAVITTLNHKPPTQPAGTCFWHVRARDAAGMWSAYGGYRTVNVLPTIPPAPALTGPANNLFTLDNTPSFTWNAVTYGDTYQLQISTSSTFTTITQDATGASGVLNYTATTLPDGKYYWRVRAWNVTPASGAWSTVRSFTVDTALPPAPALTAPGDTASPVGVPTYTWQAASTANAYEFQYATNAGFSTGVYTSPVLTTLSHKPPSQPVGSYFWHVRSRDAAGNWSLWSATRTVDILPTTPVAPALTLPNNNAMTDDDTPTFFWGAVSFGDTYQIQISTNTGFTGVVQDVTGAQGVLTYTAAALPEGKVYWRVRAHNVIPAAGAWSAYRALTIDTTDPLPPGLSALAENAVLRATPTFSWLTAATATAYQFQYATDTGFTTVVYTSAPIATRTHKPPAIPIGTYFWHVRSRDAAGNWSVYSAYRTLTIWPVIPKAPVLSSPAANFATSDDTPLFSWLSVLDGNTYQIQISTSSGFSTLLQDVTGGMGVLNYTASSLPIGTFYWRVRAINVNPEFGAWSASRVIVITP